MLRERDLITIEKNLLKYIKSGKNFKGIPPGVYEVIEGDFTPRKNYGPEYKLLQSGSPDPEPLTVDWKSLQYNTKWRKL